MTALLSRCDGTQVPAGADLSSFPNLGLIDSYKFSLLVFASGCLSALGKPNRSAKRLANFSLPVFGSGGSSLVPVVGFSERWMLPEPGEAQDFSRVFSTTILYSVLGLHGDLSTLWSAGLKIWCSGGPKKSPSTHFDFYPKWNQQTLNAFFSDMHWLCSGMQESIHAACV